METEIIKLAAPYGIFAVLFVSLFFYVLRTNDTREKRYLAREDKYQSIIEKLSESFESIKGDVKELKGKFDTWMR